MEKLTLGLSGIAGEYFVAGELSRREIMASITLRNNDSIDIGASKAGGKTLFAIQVKTSQNAVRSWPMSDKAETLISDNLFYVFVLLNGLLERPSFFIVPSKIVAERVRADHEKWFSTPGRKGQPHNVTRMRKFNEIDGEFLEKWDPLV